MPLESEEQEPAPTACTEARFCNCELTKCSQQVDITSVRKGQNMDGSCSPSTTASSGSSSCETPEVLLFACNICFFRPINPVETACGHLFCWPCMHRLLQGQAKPCPVCATLLSSDINVAPIITNYRSPMLFLPTVDQQVVERNEDESDGSSTNVTVVVPGRARVETTTDVLILYTGNKRIRRQIQGLQRRVHRAKRLLRKARNEHESVPISTGKQAL